MSDTGMEPRRLNCGELAPEVQPLTDEQVEAMLKYAPLEGLERSKHQGKAFREEDFLSGVLVVLNILGRWDMVPAGWIFTLMGGGSVVDPDGVTEAEKARKQKLRRSR